MKEIRTLIDTIDFITISTKGNGRDFGGTKRKRWCRRWFKWFKGLSFGGSSPKIDVTNIIDFVTIGTLGNETRFWRFTTNKTTIVPTSDSSGR